MKKIILILSLIMASPLFSCEGEKVILNTEEKSSRIKEAGKTFDEAIDKVRTEISSLCQDKGFNSYQITQGNTRQGIYGIAIFEARYKCAEVACQ